MVTGTDLRLAPAAAAAWATAWSAVGAPLGVALAAGLTTLAVGLALLARGGPRDTARSTARPVSRDTARGTVALALVVAGAVACSVAGHAHARGAGSLPALAADGATVSLTGTVVGTPVAVGASRRVALRLLTRSVLADGTSGPAVGTVLVIAGPRWAGLQPGTPVTGTGTLQATTPADDVVAVLQAPGAPRSAGPPAPPARAVGAVRQRLLAVTDALPGDARALVPGTAVGDTSRVGPELRAALRTSGLTHLTAVSGGHVAAVLLLLLSAGTAARLPTVARAGAGAVALTAFTLLVGTSASVVRAAGAGVVVLVAVLLRRPARAVPALAATVVALLVLDPWLSRSIGLALSVAATAAIVLVAPAVADTVVTLAARRGWSPCRPPVLRRVATAVAVPLVASLACAPVLVLVDPALTPYAVPANVVVAPVVLPLTLLGLATTLAGPVAPPLAEALAQTAAVPACWLGGVARVVAGLPGARLPWLPGPGGALLLTLVDVALLLAGRRWRARLRSG